MTNKKKERLPGLLNDPWRSTSPEPTPSQKHSETLPENLPLHVRTISTDDSPIHDDIQSPLTATIELKGYGGITVAGVEQLPHAAAQVLKFCVDHAKNIDDIFMQYGVLLTQMPITELTTKFYIQRADGWLLAVPEAKTRDEGCLQLIQAMAEAYRVPNLREQMTKYRIRPYKV